MMKRTSFFGVSCRRSCMSSKNHLTSVSSALAVGAWTWDYSDTKWFALETNRDHSVTFEIALSTEFWTVLLIMMATPFLLNYYCPQ